MVPYGVVEIAPGHFRRGTYGPLAFTDKMPAVLTAALRTSGLAVDLHNDEDMQAVQWCKLVINLGNALNAFVYIYICISVYIYICIYIYIYIYMGPRANRAPCSNA